MNTQFSKQSDSRPHISCVLVIGPHQILALGHHNSEALCCRQIAEGQQDLSHSIHSLQGEASTEIWHQPVSGQVKSDTNHFSEWKFGQSEQQLEE